MTTQRTPGPWMADKSDFKIIHDQGNNIIALVWDDKDLAAIVAVPDMIEALQDMLAAYDHEPNTYDTAATAAFERARNALQKAGVIE